MSSPTFLSFDIQIAATSMTGVCLNLFGLLIISNKRCTHVMYKYLWRRILCNLAVCTVGSGWLQTIDFDTPDSYTCKF
jgi:hypothetical protein